MKQLLEQKYPIYFFSDNWLNSNQNRQKQIKQFRCRLNYLQGHHPDQFIELENEYRQEIIEQLNELGIVDADFYMKFLSRNAHRDHPKLLDKFMDPSIEEELALLKKQQQKRRRNFRSNFAWYNIKNKDYLDLIFQQKGSHKYWQMFKQRN